MSFPPSRAAPSFGQILRRATKNNERFVVDRPGEPSVIIMSIKDYVDTIAPAPLADIQAASKRRGTDKVTMRHIDAEIAKAQGPTRKKTKPSGR